MEIGSEFWLSVESLKSSKYAAIDWLPYGNDYLFVFSGRTAIETVLSDIKDAKRAFVPAYCCASMLEPFKKNGIELEFYEVDVSEGIQVEIPDLSNIDIVLRCNYFGYKVAYPEERLMQFQKNGGIIIEDITHSLLSENQYCENSDYLVASLRKWGALLDGGFCSKRNGLLGIKPTKRPSEDFLKKKLTAMNLKADYIVTGKEELKQQYLKCFSESNSELSNNYSNTLMSEMSMNLLMSWDVKKIRNQRRKNAQFLYEKIEESSECVPVFQIDAMDCPLFIPVYISSNTLRTNLHQHLCSKGIYCPIHWPKPNEDCSSSLYDTELSIICDQRYDEKDMEYIATAIKEIGLRS